MRAIEGLGEIREDGSILLYDENIKQREGLPRRVQPSAVQKQRLAEWGLQWVRSSFISGIGVNDDDLFIRFWNGSLYQYYGFAKQYEKMLQAPSKGKYFWRNIRRTKSYAKVDTLPLPDDLALDDTQLFNEIAKEFNKVIADMIRFGVTKVVYDEVSRNEFLQVKYKGETIHLLINKTMN